MLKVFFFFNLKYFLKLKNKKLQVVVSARRGKKKASDIRGNMEGKVHFRKEWRGHFEE